MFARCKLLGQQLAGAKVFAASPDPAVAGSALRAHFSRGPEKCGLAGILRSRNGPLPEY